MIASVETETSPAETTPAPAPDTTTPAPETRPQAPDIEREPFTKPESDPCPGEGDGPPTCRLDKASFRL